MLSLQGHHSFALYLYIVSGWDFISLRQVQLFLFPFLRPLSAQMLSGPDVRTRQHFNSWFGPIRQKTKSNRFFFFLYPRSQIRFLSSAVCFCNQVTLQNQTMPFILFICRPLPQLLFPPLLFPLPPLFTVSSLLHAANTENFLQRTEHKPVVTRCHYFVIQSSSSAL